MSSSNTLTKQDIYEKKFRRLSDISQIMSCGVFSGFVQASMFNPWDRALYLSVKNNRKFLDKQNFVNPFAGVFQTLAQRALSAGLFFPLEEIFRDIVQGSVDKTSRFRPMVTLLAGAAAGSTYGIMMNPISSIKYNYWGKAECGKENFLSTAVNMYKRGGVALFFVGTSATVLRDLIFGSVFSILRHDILISKDTDTNRKSKKNSDRMNAFFIDIASASIATIASSPLNYVRDMQYSMTNDKPKSIRGQFRQLWEDTLRETSSYDRAVLLQRKLRIGWGTARVGCGMGVGSFLYSYCSRS